MTAPYAGMASSRWADCARSTVEARNAGRIAPWEAWDENDRLSGRSMVDDAENVVVCVKNRGNFSCWTVASAEPETFFVLACGVLEGPDRRERVREIADAMLAALDLAVPQPIDPKVWFKVGFVGDLDAGGMIPWDQTDPT